MPKLEVAPVETVQTDAAGFAELKVDCTPSSVEVGIPCNMEDMCGLDPCLCGPVDEWGACACNGTQVMTPQVSVASLDEGVARVVDVAGHQIVVPQGPGTAELAIHVEMAHCDPVDTTAYVEVAPFGALDVLKIALVAALVIAVVAGAVWAVRTGLGALGRRKNGRNAA
ncbi:MAG: hypothetical protein HFJ66_03835 [Eggerthellaceae bacterium]|nr:hypothetical protein [Eggerthellaceae bacterium]